MLLKPGSRLLFIGDSITDCGRRRPVGDGTSPRALGDGYVGLVQSALVAGYPDYRLQVLNMGVSGDTVRELQARWNSDVLALRPDWLSILIGINDVWKQLDSTDPSEEPIGLEVYASTLRELIARTWQHLSGLIIMTPYYLQPDRSDPMRARMDRYGSIVRQVASERQAVLVDTQAAFDQVLEWVRPNELAADGIHVNQAGHMILARAVLERVGYDWHRPPAAPQGAPR